MNRGVFGELLGLITESERICLIGHSSPDGDCIMSALALQAYLERLGKDVDIALAGKIPYNYDRYIDRNLILTGDPHRDYDIAIAVDCASAERLGIFSGIFYSAPLNVVIDHHVTNTGFGTMHLIDTQVSSTCELIYNFFESVNFKFDQKIAEYLYIGILTDTGKFRYPATSGNTHRVVGRLLDMGIRPDEVYKYIFRNKPSGIAKACGAGMAGLKVYAGGSVAVARITREIAALNDGRIDEIDGLIDWLMDIRGVRISCVLKEISPESTKVSLRSENGFDLRRLADKYRGGGHPNAAGFILHQSIAESEGLVAEELSDLAAIQPISPV